jgi:hypothetical protein
VIVEEVASAPIGRIERTTFGYRRLGADGWEHHDPGSQGAELTALIDLRDRARTLIEWEQSAELDSEPLEAHRNDLARRYERYAPPLRPDQSGEDQPRGGAALGTAPRGLSHRSGLAASGCPRTV